MSTTDKPNYPVTRPNEDTLASLRISFLSEEDEEDQIELCDLYHEVNSQDLKHEIIRKLNPNFRDSLKLVLKIIVDERCRGTSGVAFNRLKLIRDDDYETHHRAYKFVESQCPHNFIKRIAGQEALHFQNIVILDNRRL